MNFGDLKTRILLDAWPNGAPENLVDSISGYVTSALIEVQRDIPCFRYRHDDVFEACQTYWQCGATVITAPQGNILRVYTVDDEAWCRPVVLRPVSLPEFRRWQAKWKSSWRSNMYTAPASGASLPMGFDTPTTSSDAVCGRATTGIYALDPTNRRLYVGPWLQTTESLVVEWSGLKRTWSDGDEVPSDEDFIRLIRLFVEREFGRKWNSADLTNRERAFAEARADMMVTCRQESQLHGEPASAEEANAAIWSAFVPETTAAADEASDVVSLAFVGETGLLGDDTTAVADAIAENDPEYVVLLGNCKTDGDDAETAMAPYAMFTAANRLRAALGNTDLDDGNLGLDVRAVAGNPGNGRYFPVQFGPITVFVVNAGYNSAEGMVEPDGNFEGSRQSAEVMAAVLRDTNPWKVVVVHHPPYTSASANYPGVDTLRWVAELPVHLIVSAYSTVYERLKINSRTYVTVGTGGFPLDEFNATVLPGSEARELDFGFLRVDADCDSLSAKFLSSSGSVLDTFEISTPAVPATPTMPLDPFITTQPVSQAVVSGDDVTLTVVASGTSPLAYQWQRNGEIVVGATSASLAVTNVTEAAEYRVLVSNPVSAILSSAALVLPVAGINQGIETVASVANVVSGDYTGFDGLIVLLDAANNPGYFAAGGSAAHDGINSLVDSEGNHFYRVQLT